MNDFYKCLSDVSNKLVTRNKDYDELWESRRKLKLEKLTLEYKLKSMKSTDNYFTVFNIASHIVLLYNLQKINLTQC